MARRVVSFFAITSFATLATVSAQQAGTINAETHLPVPLQTCTAPGVCTSNPTTVTLDANWRWVHNAGGSTNCYTGTTWSTAYCPDPVSCAANCAVEGIPTTQWSNPYGVTAAGNGVQLQFVTQGSSGTNVGSRMFLFDESANKYHTFFLKNREFSFDVDLATLECGLNGAVYFVSMDPDGGTSEYSGNKAGAKYGTGYCDSQCPHDIKFIEGQANINNWSAATSTGAYGTCCSEIDIFEANKYNAQYTMHPCDSIAPVQCTTAAQCGDGASRYQGTCDKDGCEFSVGRLGDTTFYGPGSSYTLDSTQPFKVVTQFITADGTDTGSLTEIKRFYVQNGKTINNPESNVNGLPAYNSITDNTCTLQKNLFGDTNAFAAKGGMAKVDAILTNGLVLVLSLWDDKAVNMLWLDSTFPPTAAANTPGAYRGPCPTTSGVPATIEAQFPTASVSFQNLAIGAIGSTFNVIGAPCATLVTVGNSCAATPNCCPAATPICYEKDQYFAGCLSSCTPGIHQDDPAAFQTPWACTVLGTNAPPPGATTAGGVPTTVATVPTVASVPTTVATVPTVASVPTTVASVPTVASTTTTVEAATNGGAVCGAPGGCASVIEPYGACLQAPNCCASGTNCYSQSSCFAQCLPSCPKSGWACALLSTQNAYAELPANNDAVGVTTGVQGLNIGIIFGVVCGVVALLIGAVVIRRNFTGTRNGGAVGGFREDGDNIQVITGNPLASRQ